MSDPLQAARVCELHVHIGGCYGVDDLVDLGAPHAYEIDWTLYTEAYAQAFGETPTPANWLPDAARGDATALERIREHFVYTEADGADFSRFMAKFNFAIAILRHHHGIGGYDDCIAHAIDSQRHQGLEYVEFRAWTPADTSRPEEFVAFHQRNARLVAASCRPGFTARYVPSIPRWDPRETYRLLRQWLDEDDEASATVVGFDFCHFEEGFPPASARGFFEQFARDESDRHDGRRLDILYHVGEIYFDKSLESAVRWCHEAAELGARRLGHCTALGLDPAIAADRLPEAHVVEPVSERLDQIDYDLRHHHDLESFGVEVNVTQLQVEKDMLQSRPRDESIQRPYTDERHEQIRRRQSFVLQDLARRQVVIESCPSSNMRLGSIPDATDHPIHRFLQSNVPLAIGADDPGIFDSPLSAEIDWVVAASSLSADQLAQRLGDPRRFACGADLNGYASQHSTKDL